MTYEHVERLQKTVAVVVELLSHAQLFRDAMDYSPPSSSCLQDFPGKDTGVSFAISFSRGSSHVSCIDRWLLYHRSHEGSPETC